MEEAERQRLEACASEMVKAIETGFPANVEGIDKLKKRVGAELEFLQGLRGAFDDSSSSSSSSSGQDGDLCQLQQHETEAKNEGKKNEEEQRRTQRRQLAAAKLASTNLPHLQQIVAYVQDHRDAVTAVFHKVRVRSRNGVLGGVVDIVADGGRSWFKVTARKAIALQLIWEGRASFKKKSIVDQIKELRDLAMQCPVGSTFPSLTAVFASGVTSEMKQHLQGLGVHVAGAVVSYQRQEEDSDDSTGEEHHQTSTEDDDACKQDTQHQECTQSPSGELAQRCLAAHDFMHNTGTHAIGRDAEARQLFESVLALDTCRVDDAAQQMRQLLQAATLSPPPPLPPQSSEDTGVEGCVGYTAAVRAWLDNQGGRSRFINLDISSLVLLISDVSYGLSPARTLCDPLLVQMAEQEAEKAAMPGVLTHIWGRHLLVCQTARDGFNSIVRTIAGPRERARAKVLLERCSFVGDLKAQSVAALPLTGKVKRRTKAIFSCGAALDVPTLTANSAFLRSALQYGVHLLAAEHPGRALTETQVDRWIAFGKKPRVNEDYYHARARELMTHRREENEATTNMVKERHPHKGDSSQHDGTVP